MELCSLTRAGFKQEIPPMLTETEVPNGPKLLPVIMVVPPDVGTREADATSGA